MAADKFPHGFGAKINPSDDKHYKLYAHNPEHIPFVVCKLHRAQWFYNQSRIEWLSPEQELYVVTYEEDEKILGRTPTDEVDKFEKLDGIADGVFAGDRFTYGSMNRRELVKEIDESVQRQLTTNRLMEERGIELPQYPSIMGWEPWHYERCRILLQEISRSVGFDATQYNSKFRLAAHINALDEVLEPDRIFINGRVSAEWLRLLPKSVVACSGSSTIREKCEDKDGVPQRAKLPEILEERIEALNSWQSDLTNYL